MALGKNLGNEEVLAPNKDSKVRKPKTTSASSNGNGHVSDALVEMEGHINAINGAFAFIEFDPKGNILQANDIFLETMGYALDEIKGKHHRLFVEKEYGQSEEYKQFWKELANGDLKTGEFKRFNSNGEAVWLLASYAPVLGKDGKVEKVVKLGSDISLQKKAQR